MADAYGTEEFVMEEEIVEGDVVEEEVIDEPFVMDGEEEVVMEEVVEEAATEEGAVATEDAYADQSYEMELEEATEMMQEDEVVEEEVVEEEVVAEEVVEEEVIEEPVANADEAGLVAEAEADAIAAMTAEAPAAPAPTATAKGGKGKKGKDGHEKGMVKGKGKDMGKEKGKGKDKGFEKGKGKDGKGKDGKGKDGKGKDGKGKDGKGFEKGKDRPGVFFGLIHTAGEKTGNMLVRCWKATQEYGQEVMIPSKLNPAGASVGDRISFEVVQGKEGGRAIAVNVEIRGHVDNINHVPTGTPADLRRQVLYYFSDENLKQDSFFQGIISSNPKGWITMKTIITCPRMEKMGATSEGVKSALEGATEVEVGTDENGEEAIRRTSPAPVFNQPAPPSQPPPAALVAAARQQQQQQQSSPMQSSPAAASSASPTMVSPPAHGHAQRRDSAQAGPSATDTFYAGRVKPNRGWKSFIECEVVTQKYSGKDAWIHPSQKPADVNPGSLVVFTLAPGQDVNWAPRVAFVAALHASGTVASALGQPSLDSVASPMADVEDNVGASPDAIEESGVEEEPAVAEETTEMEVVEEEVVEEEVVEEEEIVEEEVIPPPAPAPAKAKAPAIAKSAPGSGKAGGKDKGKAQGKGKGKVAKAGGKGKVSSGKVIKTIKKTE